MRDLAYTERSNRQRWYSESNIQTINVVMII
ncbi:protein of unknown function (plasmid) [Rhodovastum atsumiense]|nr:protein of unknown function [Rhodovastum atsumiense]